jgi:hypothetical protein
LYGIVAPTCIRPGALPKPAQLCRRCHELELRATPDAIRIGRDYRSGVADLGELLEDGTGRIRFKSDYVQAGTAMT